MAINSGNKSTLVEHCLSEFVKAARQAPPSILLLFVGRFLVSSSVAKAAVS